MKMNYTMWLIIINFAVFFIQILFSNIDFITTSYGDVITDIFGLNSVTLLTRGYFWQIFTYMFIHANFIHIFYNMFGLLIFGPKIEFTMGKEKFLKFYLICGVGSSLFYMLITGINNIPMVGASGAIFGVLTAYGLMYPRDIIYVQFFLPMPAIVFVIFYGLIQLVAGFASLLVPQVGGVAWFGHLGGMITSFILLKFFGFGKRRIRYFWE
ncbi:MAG: rhomboid family intramembrane serine protease [Candidatus Aenigmarchaeota archaeon]|nr:rhomboid family intramembrane serine protease [Candidatus Aenigmarchaeota archaeon]